MSVTSYLLAPFRTYRSLVSHNGWVEGTGLFIIGAALFVLLLILFADDLERHYRRKLWAWVTEADT